MLFIMGISQKEEKLDFDELTICMCCTKYGHVEVYMTYMYFMFFFLPLYKWDKRYYVKMSCCNKFVQIDNEIGKEIECGNKNALDINNIDFKEIASSIKVCSECGFTTEDDYNYCPKCSNKL